MTIEEYRAHPALNFSRAKRILRSPAHFHAPEEETTFEMTAGTLVHDFALRGIKTPYVIRPEKAPDGSDWHGAKKVCKEWWAAQTVPVLTQEQVGDQAGMVAALESNELFRSICDLCPGRERPAFATYRDVEIKALFDMEGQDKTGVPLIVDLKTTADGSPRGFARAAAKYNYPLQCFWYSTVLSQEKGLEERPGFLFVTVENKAPYNVTVYSIPEDTWRLGERQMERIIDTYKQCRETGVWPGYSAGIQPLNMPHWALKESEEEISPE